MPDPLAITFRVLKSAGNVHAVDLLIAALEVPIQPVREFAVQALVERPGVRGKVEAMRRYRELGEPVLKAFAVHSAAVDSAFRQSLLHGDEELRANAMEIALRADRFEQLPTMLRVLDSEHPEVADLAAQTIRELLEHFYDRLQRESRHGAPSGRLAQIRNRILTALEESLSFAAEHLPLVVEATLILGHPGSYVLRRMLSNTHPECRQLAAELLKTSTHPGVLSLITDWLGEDYPPSEIIEAVRTRSDPEFALHLLRWLPARLTGVHKKNLRQVTSLPWLDREEAITELVPPGLQPAIVRLVLASGLPRNRKTEIESWLVRHGSAEGREAATAVLAAMDRQTVQQIVFEGLTAEEPEIQAWATHQLRAQGVPEAIRLLIERLDSPEEAVRNAAREELQSFDLERMLTLFEHLDLRTCRRAGELLRKIDPDVISSLRRELRHPVRRRRLRAARASVALGYHPEVADDLIAMLREDDTLIRRTAVELVSQLDTDEAFDALQELLEDSSPRLREAARRALEEMEMRRPVRSTSGRERS